MRFPTIGSLRWWHRLLGWADVRCDQCGTIGGAEKPAGASRIVACSRCHESDWLRSLPRRA